MEMQYVAIKYLPREGRKLPILWVDYREPVQEKFPG